MHAGTAALQMNAAHQYGKAWQVPRTGGSRCVAVAENVVQRRYRTNAERRRIVSHRRRQAVSRYRVLRCRHVVVMQAGSQAPECSQVAHTCITWQPTPVECTHSTASCRMQQRGRQAGTPGRAQAEEMAGYPLHVGTWAGSLGTASQSRTECTPSQQLSTGMNRGRTGE